MHTPPHTHPHTFICVSIFMRLLVPAKMTSLQNVLVLLLKYVFQCPLSIRTQISTLTHMHTHTQSPVRIMLKDLGHLLFTLFT